ncbi:uncharacterized protein [Asterias amurensis]
MELRTVAVLHRVMVVLLMCSSFVAIAYTEGCSDPRFNLIGESCLYLHVVAPYKYIYSDAVGICADVGGSVVVINTQRELDDVLTLMVAQGEREFVVWVGCKSPSGSQEFTCIDESVYYRGAADYGGFWKWQLGFPNPAPVTSTCVLFFQDKKDVADSAEYDADCELTLSPVMCEEGTQTEEKLSTTVVAKTSAALMTSPAAVATASSAVTMSSASLTTTSSETPSSVAVVTSSKFTTSSAEDTTASSTASAAVTTSTAAVTTASSKLAEVTTASSEFTTSLTTPSTASATSPAKVATSSAAKASVVERISTETTRFQPTMASETSVPSSIESPFAEPDTPNNRTCFLYGKSRVTPSRFTSSLMWHLKDDACPQNHVMRKISTAVNVALCASLCGTYESCQFINYYPEHAVCELIDTL